METNERISHLVEVLERIAAIPTKIEIVKEVELEGEQASLFVYNFESAQAEGTASAILWETGEVFHTNDWQADHPETKEEIEEYNWLTEDGRPTFVINGMPRIFAF